MTYDLEKLSFRIAEKKRRFFIGISLYALLAIVSVPLMLTGEKTVVFTGALLLILSILLALRHISRYDPAILFSKEKRGVNGKEHEYVQNAPRGLSPRRAFMLRAKTHSGSGNAGPRTARVRAAQVYIRLEDGNVEILEGLSSLQTDIYEIGDELLRPAGARYPVIVSRSAKRMPCPFCGRINSEGDQQCAACELPIYPR